MLLKKDVYNAKIKTIEDKMSDITNLATKTTLNAKRNEVKAEIPGINNLATNAVENKIPNVSKLVKRNDYNTKVNEIEKKITDHDYDEYIITPEFNKLIAERFSCKISTSTFSDKVRFW